MDSYQYRVFKERYPFLQEGVKPEVVKVAHKLYSRKLISRATGEAATLNMWTPDQKSSELLKSLDTRIKTDPKLIYDLMAVLRSIPSLRYLFRDLNERLPECLQPEFHEDPPYGEEETDGAIPDVPTNPQNPLPGAHAYILQPLYMLPPSTVTGQLQASTFSPTALAVYNKHNFPPPVLRSASIDINEVTSHLPKHILSRPCEDVPLTDIANEMISYETIYTYFGLTRVKMEDITRRYPHSPSRQRQELLLEWRDMFGKRATYKHLIYCFCQAKRQDLVSFTCEIVERRYLHEEAGYRSGETIVANPEGERNDESLQRSACQPPRPALSQDPSPSTGIPFLKQQSEVHSLPSTVAPPSSGYIEAAQQEDLTTQMNQLALHTDTEPAAPPVPEATPLQEQATTLPSQPVHASESKLNVVSEVSRLYSQTSSEDSFHTARTQCSIDDLSDEESSTEDEVLLDRITTMCSNQLQKKERKVQELKQKLKRKDREVTKTKGELKELRERLAKKENELASLLPYPEQESQPSPSALDQLTQELQVTKEYTAMLDCERKELAREYVEAQSKLETYRSQNRGLHKEVMALKYKLLHSQQESHVCKMENARLTHRVKELEMSMEFFYSNSKASCIVRSQSF